MNLAFSLGTTHAGPAEWTLLPLKQRTATTPGPKPVLSLKVLAALEAGHQTTKAIAEAAGITSTTAGKTLHSLKRGGFVRQFGNGRTATWCAT